MTCPNGHETSATDYCDTCGAALAGQEPAPAPAAPVPTPTPSAATGDQPCPNCGAPNAPDALFCEACGYDHTTGAVPQPLLPPDPALPQPAPVPEVAPAGPLAPESPAPVLAQPWVVELWVDPEWYAAQESPDPLPSVGPPRVVALRHTSVLVGRTSASRGITPEVDCGADTGVSRRHAQLTTDGTRWWVEDLGSSNGTFVADAVDPVPEDPIATGTKREVGADDRVYVGAWTRLVLRPAAPGEV